MILYFDNYLDFTKAAVKVTTPPVMLPSGVWKVEIAGVENA